MRILLVDDSALMRGILKQLFSQQGDMEVAGEAANGQAACEKNISLEPDLVVMDVNMPVMNGLDATKRMMEERPVPIIIFSSMVEAGNSFEAVSAGAFDAVRKPDIDLLNEPEFLGAFMKKVRAAKDWSPGGRKRGGPFEGEHLPGAETISPPRRAVSSVQAVVMGASTGGPLAVREILSHLPKTLPVGIALVQHLEEGFDAGYAAWLNESTEMEVKLAGEDEGHLAPGSVVVAPVNRHLVFREGKLLLDDGPRVGNQKPSVDVLFESAAKWFGKRLLGILLTGMGRDGAEGSLRIIERGGKTIVQDEKSSAIFGMPRAAIEVGAATDVVSLGEIPERILKLVM